MDFVITLIAVGVIFYLFRFGKYIGKYLVPFEISQFRTQFSPDSNHCTTFIVVFQEGYLVNVKRYRLEGFFFADRAFTEQDLKGMLSLTERSLFHRLAVFS
jgi:hypothetical protein